MKKFYLSTKEERTKGIVFAAVMIVAMAALLLLLREDLGVMLLTAAGVVLLSVVLVYYMLNVTKAAVIALPEEKKVRVEGVRSFELDLTDAVQLETIPVKNGQVMGRALAFSDAEGKVVGIVPTMFTARQGVDAEPMAIELAQILGLEFYANVPRWEYDEEARKVHEAEVAEQEKKDAAARREAKRKLRIAKAQTRKQMEDAFKIKK